MNIDIKRTELKVKIYGREQSMTVPSSREYFQYLDNLSKAGEKSEDSVLDVVEKYLIKRGMEEDLVKELEYAHLQDVVKAVNCEEIKKNKK